MDVDGTTIIVSLIICLFLFGGPITCNVVVQNTQVTTREARKQFAEQAGVSMSQVKVTRQSSTGFWTGDPWHATYTLEIAGRARSGSCSSGLFSPQTCILYGDK